MVWGKSEENSENNFHINAGGIFTFAEAVVHYTVRKYSFAMTTTSGNFKLNSKSCQWWYPYDIQEDSYGFLIFAVILSDLILPDNTVAKF